MKFLVEKKYYMQMHMREMRMNCAIPELLERVLGITPFIFSRCIVLCSRARAFSSPRDTMLRTLRRACCNHP